MNYLKLAIGAALFLAGWLVHGWYTDASQTHALTQGIKAVAKQNQATQTRTLAAATHIEAIHAKGASLKADISKRFTAPSGGTHATFAPAASTDPFGALFVMCWNSGSHGDRACQAGDVLPRPARDSQHPPR